MPSCSYDNWLSCFQVYSLCNEQMSGINLIKLFKHWSQLTNQQKDFITLIINLKKPKILNLPNYLMTLVNLLKVRLNIRVSRKLINKLQHFHSYL